MKVHDFHNTVGILRSNWYNSNQQLKQLNYGTAFAISRWILLTCTHNICSGNHRDYASEVIFITAVADGKITSRTHRYKSIPGHFYRSQTPQNIYNMRPVKQQLALIILQQPLDTQNFLKLGSISPSQLQNHLKVIGFPSQKYMSSGQLNSIQVKRLQSNGKLYQPMDINLNSHILDYTVQTAVGMSGSPVLIEQADGSYKIVGIHTHRGLTSKYNSGLYFNGEMIDKIRTWVEQIEKEYNFECGSVFCKQSDNFSTIDSSLQLQQYSSLLQIEQSEHHSQIEMSQLCEYSEQQELDKNKLQRQTFDNFYDQVYQQYFQTNYLCELQLTTHREIPSPKQYFCQQPTSIAGDNMTLNRVN